VAEERNRLAREIHDSLAHYLTVANVQLEAAERLGLERADAAFDYVQRARRLILDCLHDVRRSVASLRAATLEELALEGSLRRLVDDFSESTSLHIQLSINVPENMPRRPDVAQALYRSAQEGLTNVQRHARANKVHITVVASTECVVLTVEDDGIGPPDAVAQELRAAGFGLIGLRERVALLDGQLSFGPAPGGGSRLRVSLPIQPAAGARLGDGARV
jgi:signal transduction histidine kinase